ncbi:MAG: nucleotidyltransferase [Methanosarcinales archaeon]|nr:MAG: nucleotidyltransferase [Methanosarcinales archaeon]
MLKKHESELREKYGIKEIGVFGSYIKGEQKKGSDIEIIVEYYLDARMDLITFVELKEYLIDLVMKSALKPQIEKYILYENCVGYN